jgi:hypothetical protein
MGTVVVEWNPDPYDGKNYHRRKRKGRAPDPEQVYNENLFDPERHKFRASALCDSCGKKFLADYVSVWQPRITGPQKVQRGDYMLCGWCKKLANQCGYAFWEKSVG